MIKRTAEAYRFNKELNSQIEEVGRELMVD
jgi:hypothetical protein